MKHIILNNQNEIVAIGENYTLELDEYATKVYKKETMLHKIDGAMFDINFIHKTVATVPREVQDNPTLFRYNDGVFKKIAVN